MKAVQSAMAIRRQRRRRDEALRAKARRSSHQSDHLMLSDSGEGSLMSLDGLHMRSTRHRQMMGGVTTFHVGVVFFFMGLMLLISGLVPGYSNRQQNYWEERSKSSLWNGEGNSNAPLLLATGSFLILVGVILVIANRIATRKEDEQFSRYISRKLAPSNKIIHQSMSSAQPIHHHPKASGGHREEPRTPDGDHHRGTSDDSAPHCHSPGHLESITEEIEGSERTSKDQLFWTSDVAPVHQQPTGKKTHEEDKHSHTHNHKHALDGHQHNQGSHTG